MQMQRIGLIFLFTILITISGVAQWNPATASESDAIYRSGNVGIGSNVTPQAKLLVRGSNATQGLVISNLDNAGAQSHFALTTADQPRIGLSAESYFNIYNTGQWVFNSGNSNGGTTLPLSLNTNGLSRLFIKPDGNIGIGTTNPTFKLEVSGNNAVAVGYTYMNNPIEGANNYTRSNFGSNVYWDAINDLWQVKAIGSNDFSAIIHPNGGGLAFIAGPTDGNMNKSLTHSQFMSYEKIRVSAYGNVGIGTASPQSLLHLGTSNLGYIRTVRMTIEPPQHTGAAWDFSVRDDQSYSYLGIGYGSEQFIIQNTGNVGIGTTNPDSKLAVNGTIHSKEVKVDLDGWPDYVFEPSYNLPSLSELERYIKANKHLPEVPTASEVKENGLSLGEMNAILLKKVEELTLHLIEQDKKVEILQQSNDHLKKQNGDIMLKLKRIESQ